MSKWLEKFLDKTPQIRPDKPDKSIFSSDLSGLSGRSPEYSGENLEKSSGRMNAKTSDRSGLSVLSGSFLGHLGEKLEKRAEFVTDKPDRMDKKILLSDLSVPTSGLSNKIPDYTFEDYEERLAIAQYDGNQDEIQAYRVAYLDAFVSALTTLPYKDMLESPDQEWLERRIIAANDWLLSRGICKSIK